MRTSEVVPLVGAVVVVVLGSHRHLEVHLATTVCPLPVSDRHHARCRPLAIYIHAEMVNSV